MPINWRNKNLIIVLDKKRVHLCAPVIKKNIKDSDVTIVLSHIMYWYENHQNHQVFVLNLVHKNKRFSYIVWVSRHLGFFKVNSLLQKKNLNCNCWFWLNKNNNGWNKHFPNYNQVYNSGFIQKKRNNASS